MRAAGEGDIARAQEQKSGFGEQASLTRELEGKREEQAALKAERDGGEDGDWRGGGGVDVKGALEGKTVVAASENEGGVGDGVGGGGVQGGHGEV